MNNSLVRRLKQQVELAKYKLPRSTKFSIGAALSFCSTWRYGKIFLAIRKMTPAQLAHYQPLIVKYTLYAIAVQGAGVSFIILAINDLYSSRKNF